ncbi:MAG: hypothetical protein NTZ85_02355 [Bacteroidia bacterium]|nr:hypothetical protein [Bacteroidia bacterium]
MFKKILVLVALLALIAAPAMALDVIWGGGGTHSYSSVSSGSGAAIAGISGSYATNTSYGVAGVTWGGPQITFVSESDSTGGTLTGALGLAGAGAHQNGFASAGAGGHFFHVGP